MSGHSPLLVTQRTQMRHQQRNYLVSDNMSDIRSPCSALLTGHAAAHLEQPMPDKWQAADQKLNPLMTTCTIAVVHPASAAFFQPLIYDFPCKTTDL